jgi:hypothetical protein
MLWKEIKSWATNHNYTAKKTEDGYVWSRLDNPSQSGISKSVSKLATDIYNDMTGNKFLEHQQKYKNGT